MKIVIDIPEENLRNFDGVTLQAIKLGYQRTEPRKPWTDRERRECIRWLAVKLLNPYLTDDQDPHYPPFKGLGE